MRQLVEKIEENSKFIERERAKVSFSLKEMKMIEAWETNIKTKGTPLLTFYENWSKINKIQKRKKITKNDEIAGELPKIKRPKLSEDTTSFTKPEQKGPLVLFPSDSEDEKADLKIENEVEPPKAKKLKKKKATKKKIPMDTTDIDNVPDKGDVVQEFSVSDW